MSNTNSSPARATEPEHGFRSDVRKLGRDVGQLREDLAEIGESAREVARSGVAAATECGTEAVKRRGRQATVSVSDRIAGHPWATLGIAVGAGVIIGLLAPAIVRSRMRQHR